MSSADLVTLIEKTFDAASILLAFITILFGIHYGPLVGAREEKEADQPFAAKAQVDRITTTLRARAYLLAGLAVAVGYVFLPTAVAAVRLSTPRGWEFSPVVTAFVLITLLLCAVAFWSVQVTLQLILKRRRLSKVVDGGKAAPRVAQRAG